MVLNKKTFPCSNNRSLTVTTSVARPALSPGGSICNRYHRQADPISRFERLPLRCSVWADVWNTLSCGAARSQLGSGTLGLLRQRSDASHARPCSPQHFTDIWVAGEISGTKSLQSGHCYFTLKDEDAQLKCVCYKMTRALSEFRPKDGRPGPRPWPRRHLRSAQRIPVRSSKPSSRGATARCSSPSSNSIRSSLPEGLFDGARKRPLPEFPDADRDCRFAPWRGDPRFDRDPRPALPRPAHPALSGAGAGPGSARTFAAASNTSAIPDGPRSWCSRAAAVHSKTSGPSTKKPWRGPSRHAPSGGLRHRPRNRFHHRRFRRRPARAHALGRRRNVICHPPDCSIAWRAARASSVQFDTPQARPAFAGNCTGRSRPEALLHRAIGKQMQKVDELDYRPARSRAR